MQRAFVFTSPQWALVEDGSGEGYVVLPPNRAFPASGYLDDEVDVEIPLRDGPSSVLPWPASMGAWTDLEPDLTPLDLMSEDEMRATMAALGAAMDGSDELHESSEHGSSEGTPQQVLLTDSDIAVGLGRRWLVIPSGARLNVDSASQVSVSRYGTQARGADGSMTGGALESKRDVTLVRVSGISPEGTAFAAISGKMGELVEGHPDLNGALEMSTRAFNEKYGLRALGFKPAVDDGLSTFIDLEAAQRLARELDLH